MRYLKTKQQYKASNFLFEVNGQKAWSYNWWQFSTKVNGHIIFNNSRYSSSTSGHQSKARQLLSKTPSLVLWNTTKNLKYGVEEAIQSEINYLINVENIELARLINKKGTRKAKNEERKQIIEQNYKKVREIIIFCKEELGIDLKNKFKYQMLNKNGITETLFNAVVKTDNYVMTKAEL